MEIGGVNVAADPYAHAIEKVICPIGSLPARTAEHSPSANVSHVSHVSQDMTNDMRDIEDNSKNDASNDDDALCRSDMRQGRPARLYPDDERLPWHFSWLPDQLVAGSSAPTDRIHYSALLAEGVHLIVNLTEAPFEPLFTEPAACARCAAPSTNIAACCASDLFDSIRPHHDMHALFIPVEDGEVPSYGQIDIFLRHALDFTARGARVVVHCQAGVGRTGIFLAAYLIETLGCSASEAISYLRHFRPQSMQFCPDDWFTDPFRLMYQANFRRNLVQERFVERYYRDVVLPRRNTLARIAMSNTPTDLPDLTSTSVSNTSLPEASESDQSASDVSSVQNNPADDSVEVDASYIDGDVVAANHAIEAALGNDASLPRADSSETIVDPESSENAGNVGSENDLKEATAATGLPIASESIVLGGDPLIDLDLIDAEIDMILSRNELRSANAQHEASEGAYSIDDLCHLCRGTSAIGPLQISAAIYSPSPFISAGSDIYTPSPLLIGSAASAPTSTATSTLSAIATTSVVDDMPSTPLPSPLLASSVPPSPRCLPESSLYPDLVPVISEIRI